MIRFSVSTLSNSFGFAAESGPDLTKNPFKPSRLAQTFHALGMSVQPALCRQSGGGLVWFDLEDGLDQQSRFLIYTKHNNTEHQVSIRTQLRPQIRVQLRPLSRREDRWGGTAAGPAHRDEPSQTFLCRSSLVAFPSLHDEKEFLHLAGRVKLRRRFVSSRVILASFSTL